MVGDLLNGRTVRSLCYLLSMYPATKVYFVSPPVVRMKDDIKAFLMSKGVSWEEVGGRCTGRGGRGCEQQEGQRFAARECRLQFACRPFPPPHQP
jgi:hypothetical protein